MERQRIDKWLWHARVVRTRSAASALVGAGHVRVNGQRSAAPSRLVRAEDVITIALDRAVRILKVVDFAERRGDAAAGRTLYADLTPLPAAESPGLPPSPQRDAGTGRPTKRDRRAIDRLQGEED